MNRDVVCGTSDTETLLHRLGIAAPPLLETAIDDHAAAQGAATLSTLGAATFLGGSAYNTARVAGLLNAAHRGAELEFFGLAGSFDGAAPHLHELGLLGFDTAGVTQSQLPPATCLALVEPHGRTLLTASGANTEIGALLRDHADAFIDGFARCDLVHLTSFLDPDVPGLLADIVARARRKRPALLVSIDPGILWARPEQPSIRALLAQCQILHANSEEMSILTDQRGIGGLGGLLAQPDWTVVARTHDEVVLHRAMTTEIVVGATHDPVAVIDAVGAGDTFTGAFLWAWQGRGDDAAAAARFGFAAARAKIAQLGPISAAALAEIGAGGTPAAD